ALGRREARGHAEDEPRTHGRPEPRAHRLPRAAADRAEVREAPARVDRSPGVGVLFRDGRPPGTAQRQASVPAGAQGGWLAGALHAALASTHLRLAPPRE